MNELTVPAREKCVAMLAELEAARGGPATEVDRELCIAFCLAWGRLREAESNIAKHGATVLSRSGWESPSAWHAIAVASTRLMLAIARELKIAADSKASSDQKAPQLGLRAVCP